MLPEKRKADLRKELRTLVWLPLFVIVMCGFVIALEFHRHEWFGGSIQFIPIAVNVWVLRRNLRAIRDRRELERLNRLNDRSR